MLPSSRGRDLLSYVYAYESEDVVDALNATKRTEINREKPECQAYVGGATRFEHFLVVSVDHSDNLLQRYRVSLILPSNGFFCISSPLPHQTPQCLI